jgi:hypothetical protein
VIKLDEVLSKYFSESENESENENENENEIFHG